jgi:hypothetical protein
MDKTTLPIFLQYFSAWAQIATPLLVLLIGSYGLKMRKIWENRLELENKEHARRIELEDKLRDDRIATYTEIVEPFIVFLMSEEQWKSDPKNKNRDRNKTGKVMLHSLAYRKQAFNLALVGSDSVVSSYNDLLQYILNPPSGESPTESDIIDLMSHFGRLLLEIRKSTGNEHTALDHWNMLEWFLTDAKTFREIETRNSKDVHRNSAII